MTQSTINPTQPATDADLLSAPVRGNFQSAYNDINNIYNLIAAIPMAQGTMTSVNIVSANGISGSVTNPSTNASITLSLGSITPTSVNSVVLTGNSTPALQVNGTAIVQGTNTGDQTINLTGAVTGTGTGTIVTSLSNTGVVAGAYPSANVTVGSDGRISTISSNMGSPVSFDAIQSGTNTQANMFVGTGSTISASGSGTIVSTSTTGNAATVSTINGLITQGTNVTITGSGTSISPYNISSSGGSGGSFTDLTSGTNTQANMLIGNGASLGVAGSGTLTATSAPASGLTGTTLASNVTASSLTSFGASIALGTPASGVLTNTTGTAPGLTAGNVTTNANLTGPITSVGNATAVASSISLPGSPTTTTQTALANNTTVATTAYVDTAVSVGVSGLTSKGAAACISTTNIAGAYVAGVFTVTATGALTIDGVSCTLGTIVALVGQTGTGGGGLVNGLYSVTTAGSIGVAAILTRTTNYNTSALVVAGTYFVVDGGTANTGTFWLNTTSGAITLGVTTLVFTEVTIGSLPASSLTGTTLASNVTASSLTSFGASIALGTPASGVLTNCTGLPVSSGISGLGTGVATWLATPTSANLASAVATTSTGSGSLVFHTSPTFVTPILGVASATNVAVTGSAIPANGMYLSAANTLDFSTNSAKQLEISSVGLVTIGTTSEAAGLAINTNVNGGITLTSNNTSGPAFNLASTSSGGKTFQFFSTGSANTPGWFGVYNATDTNTQFAISGAGSGGAINGNASSVFGWTSNGGNAVANADTGISRDSAGVVDIGTGGQGSKAGTINATTANFTGTATIGTATTTKTTANVSIQNNNAVTVTSNAGTCPITFSLNTFTNSSAATMAITIATASAVDGQKMVVRIYDFSAVTQTIGWTNTENSIVSVPTTSNGSTTLPLTVGFMFNSATTKWRCIAVA